MSFACSRSPSVPGRRWLDVYCKLIIRRLVCCGVGPMVPPSTSSRDLAQRPPSSSASCDAMQSLSMSPANVRDRVTMVGGHQTTARMDDGSCYNCPVTVEDRPRNVESELRHRVFLYGTLKQGQPNHSKLYSPTTGGRLKFVGRARSTRMFPLIVTTRWNIPFLLHEPGKGQMIDGEVYEVDDCLLAWMDAFEGHPEVYERDVIEVKLLPTNSASVVTACATTSSCRSHDDGSTCGTVSGGSERTNSERSDKQSTNNEGHHSVKTTKAEAEAEAEICAPNDVNVAAVCEDEVLGKEQQQQQQQTCTCFIYFYKRYPPELVEFETYESYDAFNIPGKPYQPDQDLTDVNGIQRIEQELTRECKLAATKTLR